MRPPDLIPLFGGVDAATSRPTDPELASLAGDRLVAHFAGREGGVSMPPYDSLNVGFSTADDSRAVLRNRERIGEALAVPLDHWLVSGQVHGSEVLVAEPSRSGEGARQPSELRGDAVFIPEPGVFALALSADCPLVVLVDPRQRTAGVAHAGWRGTASGVLENLVQAFLERGSAPEQLWGAISPGICAACYPVGEEVFSALHHIPGRDQWSLDGHLDLRVVHARILALQGISRVTRDAHCSSCSTTASGSPRFFSHRRDAGLTGRNGALVGWRT